MEKALGGGFGMEQGGAFIHRPMACTCCCRQGSCAGWRWRQKAKVALRALPAPARAPPPCLGPRTPFHYRLGPSVPAPVAPQQCQSPAPHSHALPGHGPHILARPQPVPRKVPDARSWSCPSAPRLPAPGWDSGTDPGCQAQQQ